MNRDFRLIGCLTKWQCWSECSVGRSIGWKDWCICRSGGQLVRRLLVCSFGWLVAYLYNCFFCFFCSLLFVLFLSRMCIEARCIFVAYTEFFFHLLWAAYDCVYKCYGSIFVWEHGSRRNVIIYWRIKKF